MRSLTALAVVVLALLAAQPADAHPLGNFTVNRYSRIDATPSGVTLRYVLDLAEIPTLQELGSVTLPLSDPDRDRILALKTQQVRGGVLLTVDGRPLQWAMRDTTLDLLPGQAGLNTLRLSLSLTAPATLSEGATLVYRDRNYEGRAGWHELVLRGASGIALRGRDVSTVDRSDELRNYPSDPALVPPDQSFARATVHVGSAEAEIPDARASSGSPRFRIDLTADRLTDFMRRSASGDGLALGAALLVAAVFGALHALGPGHGKTVVAAYLVGSKGTMRQALILGLTVTATHTAGVYALGLLTLFAAQYVLPERLYPALGLLSGALIVAIGGSRLLRLGRRRGAAVVNSAHAVHPHEHQHSHGGDHSHVHGSSLREIVGLGVSGGLLPCPTALVVLLSAISLRSVLLGMTLVVAFSFGLAAVLTGIGLALVLGTRLARDSAIAERLRSSRVGRLAPVASALGITAAGALIALQAIATAA